MDPPERELDLAAVVRVARAARVVFAAALGSAASLDCLEAGFTASLRCSSCAKLESLVPDPELAADCGACCSEDLSASASYASAILEVCE